MIISAMMGSSGQPQWPGRLLRQRGSSEDRAKPVVTLLLTAVTTFIFTYNAFMQPHYGGTGHYIWNGATPNLEHNCFHDVNASCPVQRIAARQRRSMQHVSQLGHQQPKGGTLLGVQQPPLVSRGSAGCVSFQPYNGSRLDIVTELQHPHDDIYSTSSSSTSPVATWYQEDMQQLRGGLWAVAQQQGLTQHHHTMDTLQVLVQHTPVSSCSATGVTCQSYSGCSNRASWQTHFHEHTHISADMATSTNTTPPCNPVDLQPGHLREEPRDVTFHRMLVTRKCSNHGGGQSLSWQQHRPWASCKNHYWQQHRPRAGCKDHSCHQHRPRAGCKDHSCQQHRPRAGCKDHSCQQHRPRASCKDYENHIVTYITISVNNKSESSA